MSETKKLDVEEVRKSVAKEEKKKAPPPAPKALKEQVSGVRVRNGVKVAVFKTKDGYKELPI
jgi:hypothetical protein